MVSEDILLQTKTHKLNEVGEMRMIYCQILDRMESSYSVVKIELPTMHDKGDNYDDTKEGRQQ